MKRVPFLIIEAAKQCDDEAVNFIRHGLVFGINYQSLR